MYWIAAVQPKSAGINPKLSAQKLKFLSCLQFFLLSLHINTRTWSQIVEFINDSRPGFQPLEFLKNVLNFSEIVELVSYKHVLLKKRSVYLEFYKFVKNTYF